MECLDAPSRRQIKPLAQQPVLEHQLHQALIAREHGEDGGGSAAAVEKDI